jgi:hypothetical protein
MLLVRRIEEVVTAEEYGMKPGLSHDASLISIATALITISTSPTTPDQSHNKSHQNSRVAYPSRTGKYIHHEQ